MRVCPYCHSINFDDLDTCFGCLHQYTAPQRFRPLPDLGPLVPTPAGDPIETPPVGEPLVISPTGDPTAVSPVEEALVLPPAVEAMITPPAEQSLAARPPAEALVDLINEAEIYEPEEPVTAGRRPAAWPPALSEARQSLDWPMIQPEARQSLDCPVIRFDAPQPIRVQVPAVAVQPARLCLQIEWSAADHWDICLERPGAADLESNAADNLLVVG